MASFINTNISSLNAQRNLTTSQASLQTSLQRLSSGLRINSAKDDSAGMAISTRMSAQINGMNQASRNANDAISMSQTAEGAMGSINDILLRMRDLSVQAANGSNGDKERASIQGEVDQLYAEIDRISGTTNFNGVKLLDGSVKKTEFQVGADANQTISFSIGEVSTKAMKLGTGGGDMSSGRIASGTNLSTDTDSLLINGTAISFASSDDTAAEYAAAINLNAATTGVTASAYNKVEGKVGANGITSNLTIQVASLTNGAGTAISVDASNSMEELVANINRQVGGVTASIGEKGNLVLANDTGAKITIAGNAATLSGAGLEATSYDGFLSLKSKDGSTVGITGKNINSLGFNVSSGAGQVTGSGAVTTTATGGTESQNIADALTALNSTKGAIETDDKISINGVSLDPSATSALTSANTAAEKAAAINLLSEKTNVTATATTSAYVESTSFSGDVTINGVTLTGITSAASLASAVGSKISGVTATYDSTNNRAILTSSTGSDIFISTTDAAAGSLSVTAPGNSTAQTLDADGEAVGVRGQLTLTSKDGSAVQLKSESATAATDLAKLGLVAQASTAEGTGKLNVKTAAGAQDAIKRIDEAIDFIANQRATMGAVQNRFTSTISNLQTSVENISASRSRIQDADFASETANMTRNQILQQAGTAMLAQANSLPNGVLSLLRG